MDKKRDNDGIIELIYLEVTNNKQADILRYIL